MIARIMSRTGFGFIQAANTGKDVFFHCSSVKNGVFEELEDGDRVSFEMEDGPKGKVVVNVTRTETEEEEDSKD